MSLTGFNVSYQLQTGGRYDDLVDVMASAVTKRKHLKIHL